MTNPPSVSDAVLLPVPSLPNPVILGGGCPANVMGFLGVLAEASSGNQASRVSWYGFGPVLRVVHRKTGMELN